MSTPSAPSTPDELRDLAAAIIHLPGRPVAAGIARELLFAGADLTQCVIGTITEEKLHLFRYGQGIVGLLISQAPDGYDIATTKYDMKSWRSDCYDIHPIRANLSATDAAQFVNAHFTRQGGFGHRTSAATSNPSTL